MAGGPGPSSEPFDWPPTVSDLTGITVLPVATPPVPAAAGLSRHPRLRRARARLVRRLRRLDNLVLLAAGILLGAAVPTLDTAPPTRLGLRTGSMPTVAAAPLVPTAPGPSSTPATRGLPAAAAAGSALPSETAAAARETATPAPAGSKRRVTDPRTRQVLAVVRAYERAWTRMDAKATRAIWPEADVRSLTRDFTALREQRLTLSGCRVRGSHDEATASCVGTLRYRPRKGDHSTRVQHGRWQFHVERHAQRWVITGVNRG